MSEKAYRTSDRQKTAAERDIYMKANEMPEKNQNPQETREAEKTVKTENPEKSEKTEKSAKSKKTKKSAKIPFILRQKHCLTKRAVP